MRIANRGRGSLLWRLLLALLVWLPLALPQAALVVAGVVYRRTARDLPEVPALDELARRTPQSSRILAADGTLLAEIPFVDADGVAGHRTWLPYAALPPRLIAALLAAEDARFFEHTGVDLRAVARAAYANLRAGHTVEGASTITQQLARNLLPEEIGRERTARRKLREMLLARRIEDRYGKAQILEAYANLVFLGAGAYGVAAAARAYFDLPVADLDDAQAALIAGLIQAPGRTNPWREPAAARARRDEVLDRELRAGLITPEAHAAARARPLALRAPPAAYGAIAPWMAEAARREIEAADPAAYRRGGITVWTTTLPATAAAAEDAARRGAARVAARAGGPPPQVGAYLLDQDTGYVEVLVGGLAWQGQDGSRFDRATQACRQPGSAFKPIVYLAALERDLITQGTPLRDAPVTEYDEDRGVYWKPRNRGVAFRGIALAQDALAASLNAPAIDVMGRVGTAAVRELAARLGITSPLADVHPLVLGASCVIPADLARAFATVAARGRRPDPVLITRVAVHGRVVLDRSDAADPFLAADRRLDRLAALAPPAPVVDEVRRRALRRRAHDQDRPAPSRRSRRGP